MANTQAGSRDLLIIMPTKTLRVDNAPTGVELEEFNATQSMNIKILISVTAETNEHTKDLLAKIALLPFIEQAKLAYFISLQQEGFIVFKDGNIIADFLGVSVLILLEVRRYLAWLERPRDTQPCGLLVVEVRNVISSVLEIFEENKLAIRAIVAMFERRVGEIQIDDTLKAETILELDAYVKLYRKECALNCRLNRLHSLC